MPMSQRRALLMGVALLACSAVLLKTAITRLSTVLFGWPAGFIPTFLPFIGLAIGAAIVLSAPALVRPPRFFSALAYTTCAISISAVIAIIVLIQPIWVNALAEPKPRLLLIPCLAALIPFTLAGIVVSGAIRHAAPDLGKILFAACIGLAFGEVGASAVPLIGGGRIGLVSAVLAAAASFSFLAGGQQTRGEYSWDEKAPSGSVVATFALGVCVLLAGDIGTPWLKLTQLRFSRMDRAEFTHWGTRSLVTVDKTAGNTATLFSDGAAAELILANDKQADPIPSEIAYTLHRGQGIALIVAPGTGQDIKRALKGGHREVHAVEPDLVIADRVIRGKYAEFTGNLYSRPEVQVAYADPRSFVRRIPQPYRAVVLPLVNVTSPFLTGGLSLLESPLITVEAFHDYIERLTPDGTLVVTRFDSEFERLVATAASALRNRGITQPRDHLFACSINRVTSLLIKKSPIRKDELSSLRSACKRSRFNETLAPDQPTTPRIAQILSIPKARSIAIPGETDISPPTDDRPYFFFNVPAHLVPRALLQPSKYAPGNEGVFVLGVSFLATFAIAAALFIIFALARPARLLRSPERAFRTALLLFGLSAGTALGVGSGAVCRNAAAIIDHPENGMAVSVIVLMVFTALGSLTSDKVPLPWLALVAGRRAQLLTALISVYAVAHTTASSLWMHYLGPLPLIARFGIAVVPLVIVGLLAGSLAPLGLRLLSVRAPQLLPWCFSLLCAGCAFGLVFAKVLAIHLGYSAILFAAGLACLIASVFLPPIMVRPHNP